MSAKESLLDNVMAVLAGKEVPPIQDIIPEITGEHSGQVHLGKRGEAHKRVIERLVELRKEDTAELVAKAAKIEEELKAEREAAKSGEFSLKDELKKGTPREELATKRAASEIAQEAVYLLQENLDEVDDEIKRIYSRVSHMRDQRVKGLLRDIQTSHMIYLQSYCGGEGAQIFKLNPQRTERAYKVLLSSIEILKDLLKDDQLVNDAVNEVTQYAIPATYQDLLWHFLSPRSRKEFEGAEPAEITKALNTKSDSNKKEK